MPHKAQIMGIELQFACGMPHENVPGGRGYASRECTAYSLAASLSGLGMPHGKDAGTSDRSRQGNPLLICSLMADWVIGS